MDGRIYETFSSLSLIFVLTERERKIELTHGLLIPTYQFVCVCLCFTVSVFVCFLLFVKVCVCVSR